MRFKGKIWNSKKVKKIDDKKVLVFRDGLLVV